MCELDDMTCTNTLTIIRMRAFHISTKVDDCKAECDKVKACKCVSVDTGGTSASCSLHDKSTTAWKKFGNMVWSISAGVTEVKGVASDRSILDRTKNMSVSDCQLACDSINECNYISYHRDSETCALLSGLKEREGFRTSFEDFDSYERERGQVTEPCNANDVHNYTAHVKGTYEPNYTYTKTRDNAYWGRTDNTSYVGEGEGEQLADGLTMNVELCKTRCSAEPRCNYFSYGVEDTGEDDHCVLELIPLGEATTEASEEARPVYAAYSRTEVGGQGTCRPPRPLPSTVTSPTQCRSTLAPSPASSSPVSPSAFSPSPKPQAKPTFGAPPNLLRAEFAFDGSEVHLILNASTSAASEQPLGALVKCLDFFDVVSVGVSVGNCSWLDSTTLRYESPFYMMLAWLGSVFSVCGALPLLSYCHNSHNVN